MIKTLFVFCVLFLVAVFGAPQVQFLFTPQEVASYGARCLDGSPSGFYFMNATAPNAVDKYVIYLQGGGYCIPNKTMYPEASDVEDCYDRRKTNLGTSTRWDASSFPNLDNPSYTNTWNQIFVPYCSGDLWAGTKTTATGSLYYAGHLTVIAVFQKLQQQFGMNNASQILLFGKSAGGIAVLNNIDYIRKYFIDPVKTKIWVYPNAGWFVNYPQFDSSDPRNRTAAFGIMCNFANCYVNQKCGTAIKAPNSYLCLLADFGWPYVGVTPDVTFFVAESYFDTAQLSGKIVGFGDYDFSDKKENNYIVTFGQNMRASTLQVNSTQANGLFLTSALTHTLSTNQAVNGNSLGSTLNAWLSKTGNWKVVDPCSTPNCMTIPL